MGAAENPRHNMIDCGRRSPAPPAQPARRSTPPALTHWPSTSKKRPADKPQCGPCVPRAALGSVARRAPARVRCTPLTGPRHLSCPSAGYVNPAPARAAWTEGSPQPVRDGGFTRVRGLPATPRPSAWLMTVPQRRPVTTITDESPRPVTARRSAHGTPRAVPNRVAVFAVAGLVYVLPIAVAVSVGATARACRVGAARAESEGRDSREVFGG